MLEQSNIGAQCVAPIHTPEELNAVRTVSLVLFADSSEADFFDDEVLEITSAACRGFVQLLEMLHSSAALKPIPTVYRGFQVVEDEYLNETVAELKGLGVKFEDAGDHGWKESLTLRTLHSLDLEVERFMNLI